MTHTVEITSLAHGGDGIARIDGMVCFVPYGLPGDTLKVHETRRTKNALWAAIDEVVEASPYRQDAVCDNFGSCGNCSWGHFAYPAQAEWKQRIVHETLERLGGIQCELVWIEDPDLRTGYRTRAEFHGDGEKLGFFAPGTHDIVNITHCPLLHPRLNAALEQLHGIRLAGGVTVTVNPEGEETLVWTKFTKRKLKNLFPSANASKDTLPRSQFLFDGVPIVNGCFSQASLLLNRLLMREVHTQLGKASPVLDLYCGSGNLSITLSERVEVTGIDHNPEATRAANKIRRGAYRRGGEEAMQRTIATGGWNAIVLDPPRTGAKDLIPALTQASAAKIVYVSCDPATLARDLKSLTGAGWALTRAALIDLFPNTPHVETVVTLERG